MPEKQYWGYNSIGVNSMGSIMATVVLASTVITTICRKTGVPEYPLSDAPGT